MAERVGSIDTMKAIGIVLVVLGHCEALQGATKTLIFAFHMPLFFLISGMLVSQKKLSLPFAGFVKIQAQSLLVPYLFYFCLSVLFWAAKTRVFPDGHTLSDALAGGLWGYGDRLFVNSPLWFFPALFVVSLMFYLLRQWVPRRLLLMSCVCLSLFGISVFPLPWGRLPWSIENAIVALMFYALGSAMSSVPSALQRQSRVLMLAGMLVSFAIWVWLANVNGPVDLNKLVFGRYTALYPLSALAGISGCVLLSTIFPSTRLDRWLSENTIVIFPLHGLIFQVISAFFIVVFRFRRDFQDDHWGWAILYTAVTILACWPISIVLRSLVPTAAGLRRAPR